jgi:hypothetical protein
VSGPRVGGGPAADGQPLTDREWLEATVALSRRSPPSRTAFSVGALVVDAASAISSAWSCGSCGRE